MSTSTIATPWKVTIWISQFESHVFVLDVEDILTKVSSPLDLEQCYIRWWDLSPSTMMFYSFLWVVISIGYSQDTHVAGFYALPIQPLDFYACQVPSDQLSRYMYQYFTGYLCTKTWPPFGLHCLN